MDNQVHNAIVSFIWGIADDCLRDIYVRGKYRDVILPMTVIRRLDALLEDSKDAVLAMKARMDAAGIANQWPALCQAAGQAFCNASPFRLRDLTSRAKKQTLKADFIAYLDGFSPNVQLILDKFKFRNQIDTMVDADILGSVIEKFVSPDINLSPNPVYKDVDKKVLKHPGLDNHAMGTIFEELIRKFNEENNEEAGEHWTPRDVVELMADLVFLPIADQIKDATYSCYDGACGTGGMLTVAQERLMKLAKERGKDVSIHYFLARIIKKGVAYHIGYLPAAIRMRIEDMFRQGKISTMFCTSTLLEGVNLPADNLFITDNKISSKKMTPVDFRNLIGRVGRIRFNLYGNVFLVSEGDNLKQEDYVELLKKEVPDQTLSIEAGPKSLTNAEKKYVVGALLQGNIELVKRSNNAN